VTDTGIAKIADFGCSKQMAGMCTVSLDESMQTIRGSVPWMAPEVIKQSGYGRSSDIWSVGATIIEMGKVIFDL
jgi:serine/threonine protein kinase